MRNIYFPLNNAKSVNGYNCSLFQSVIYRVANTFKSLTSHHQIINIDATIDRETLSLGLQLRQYATDKHTHRNVVGIEQLTDQNF